MSTALPNRETSRVPIIATLLVITVVLLLAFTYATTLMQHATTIFAQGQARWIQAHIQTVEGLRRYARTGDPSDYATAQAAMQVPIVFERARLHLASRRPDRDAAVREFMAGGLERADAERAAWFGRAFRVVPFARATLEAWATGDAKFDTLVAIGTGLRDAHARGDSATLLTLTSRIDDVDRSIYRSEHEFTVTLASAARLLPPIVVSVGMLLGAIFIIAGTVTIQKVARSADRSRAAEVEHFLKLRALMAGVPDTITWYDRDHRITYVNPALEEFTGLGRVMVVGLTHAELARHTGASPDVAARWEDALKRAFAGDLDTEIVVDSRSVASGPRSVQVRFVAQRGQGGEVETVAAIGRDITEIRRSEALLRERDAQLQHAQKMEAIGRLAGGVAHEFNNILTAITANLELALLVIPEESDARDDLHAALTAARRASGLTRQLLVFGRRDPVERRLVDVGQVVSEVDVMMKRLAGPQVEVVTSRKAASPLVMADPGQLQQILLNLVSNARDAMPDGGVVHVDVDCVSGREMRARPGLVTTATPPADHVGAGDWITLAVADTGTGMDADTVQRLFEPFFTTKPRGVGTGLGLPVVAGIVTQLGGRIHVDTAPGRGTAVTIGLPAAHGAGPGTIGSGQSPLTTTAEQVAARTDGGPRGRGEVVLLVEDEPPVRTATRRMLESAGYEVVEAKHADDALLQWRERPAHIVVTDFMMPGLNGAELLAQLRAMRPDLPAVIVSGYTGGGVIDEASLGGRTAIVQKPFTRADLLQRVHDVLLPNPV